MSTPALPRTTMVIEMSLDLDSGEPFDFFVRGHLDRTLFLAALAAQEDLTASPDVVRHDYLRKVPWLPNSGEAGSWYQILTSPGRGATKVTIVDAHDTREIVDPVDISGKD